MISLILTHPGSAHKDEFLACCLLVAVHGVPIVRRETAIGVLAVQHREPRQYQEVEIEAFRQVVEVNLNSLMSCALKFHALLMARKGSLITISSTAAFHATHSHESGI